MNESHPRMCVTCMILTLNCRAYLQKYKWALLFQLYQKNENKRRENIQNELKSKCTKKKKTAEYFCVQQKKEKENVLVLFKY